ncbi:MAG: Asp-tRNA(Asn)/Glu-tRNA(Gln) amidotransferase subunit GatB [Clostridiaceae bacterium]|nr:Asp-tRNA(Asn)/Glu-tRNA(Gln) amidotransferase subunit GatB [Clostridiaceae bacterium]
MIYETVIGLEVHVELSSVSKIFCGCPTTYGQEPNTQCCPVCMGLPGALPVLNRQVVEFAIRTALATHCAITPLTRFDRKNYFYPDLPKAYQISQLHQPIGRGGYVLLPDSGKTIGIHEIHMEEDAGKLIHDPWEDCTLVDYNRCGVPLLEIVSEPDMRSAEEALAYLEKLRGMLQFLGVSDCRMQEGSLRADVNVSVRPAGSEILGVRTEMKNMNSFKAIGRAIATESRRQIEMLEEGKPVRQETRRWDDNKDASFTMRSKEDAQDYRYFPDPDLTAIRIGDAWIQAVQADLPELPEARRRRYQKDFGLTPYEADILTTDPVLAGLFEETTAISRQPKDAAAWIMGEFLQNCKEQDRRPDEMPLAPAHLARLIQLVNDNVINRIIARKVFQQVLLHQADPDRYIDEQGLRMERNPDTLKQTIMSVLAEYPQSVADYRAGKTKAAGFLVGQVMRATQGQADPQLLNQLVREALEQV